MIKVGIIGATGYTGIELLRLLCPRDDIVVAIVTSREHVGTKVQDYFPNLRGHLDLCFSNPETVDFSQCDVVFYATPHGVAMRSAALLPPLVSIPMLKRPRGQQAQLSQRVCNH